MKYFTFAFLLLFFAVQSAVAPAVAQTQKNNSGEVRVWPHLFGLTVGGGLTWIQPWPKDSFNSARLLLPETSWGYMNPSQGTYNFTTLDAFMNLAQAHNTHLMLVFLKVPQWASSKPNDGSCSFYPGACDPPNDLNADGSGTDQHWKDFLTALVTHSVNSKTGHINYYELWNEPMNPWYWTGTNAQLIRMAADAYTIIHSIDPNALLSSPSFAWETQYCLDWMQTYLAAGGGQYADRIDVHGYVDNRGGYTGWPENMATFVPEFFQVLKQTGQLKKPVWNTEASWGTDNSHRHLDDPDLQAAWIARMYILSANYRIARLFWFSWSDPGLGTLWVPDPHNPGAPGTLLKPGIAYQQVYNWIVGTTINQQCSPNGTIWTCGFTRPDGYVAEAVWDTSETCQNGVCTTKPYNVGSEYVRYLTVSGDSIPINGSTVPVGAQPIFLENQ
ncbi:MAG TPA: cellulase family glycosylhydrolase [Terriglobales bacterium]|jgi:hypothetical protein|nr:cellulase family glycosylhydrolase [Terriglobales bacterium]